MRIRTRIHRKRHLASDQLPPITFEHLPPDIAAKLTQAVRRIKAIIWIRGLLAVAAALLIAIIVMMAIDAMVMIYTSGVRWLLWGGGLLAGLLTALHMLVRPLSRPFTPGRIAALIEQNHPELDERLSTVVELLSSPDAETDGATQLLRVLTDAAVDDVRTVSPKQEFTGRTVKPKLVVAAAALGVIALLFLIWPKSTGRLILRAVVPSARVDNLYADNLHVVPGDCVVLKGAPLAIDLAVHGGFPGVAYIRTRLIDPPGATEVVERMRQISADSADAGRVRHYRHLIANVPESLTYRIVCGSALTRYYRVEAVPIPAFRNMTLALAYPPYTGLPAVTLPETERAIEGVPGTRVRITIEPERPLKSTLVLPEGRREADTTVAGQVSWQFTLGEPVAGVWRVEVSDANGFTNPPSAFPYRVIRDQPPQLAVLDPEMTAIRMPPHSRLPVRLTATDDFGLAAVDVRVSRDNEPFEVLRHLALRADASGTWHASDSLDPARLGLSPGGVIRVQWVATDNLPADLGGPNQTLSPIYTLTIDAAAESMALQMMEAQFEKMDAATQAVHDALAKALQHARAALEQVDRTADSAALRELAVSKTCVLQAEAAVRMLMADASGSLFERLIPELRRLLEQTIHPALQQADEALLVERDDRRGEVQTLIAILSNAVMEVEALLERVEAEQESLRQLTEMEDLADRQEALADQAQTDATEDLLSDDWLQEQAAVQEAFEEQAPLLPLDAPLAATRERVEAFADAVDALEREQEALKERVEQLADESLRDAAAEALAELTPELPAHAEPEARAAALQEALSEQLADLAGQVSDLADDLALINEALAAPVSDPLAEAADQLEQAQQAATDAADALGQAADDVDAVPHMDQSMERMAAAAEALRTSAGEMDALGERLAEQARAEIQAALDAMAAAQPGEPEEGPAAPQAEAPSPPPAQQAAEPARRAADAMQRLAEQLARQQGVPTRDERTLMRGPPPRGEPGMEPDPNPPVTRLPEGPMPDALKQMGLSEADWFKLRGDISGGALDAFLAGVPAEYRGLVKAYFIELSKADR